MSDISLSAGVDTSQVATGMATIRNEVQALGNQVQSTLAQSFAAGAVVASLNQVINTMHDIHHEAERFNVDGESLQKITIPAKDAGVSVEQVARAMNYVTLAGAKAAEGNVTFSDAFAQLNINVEEFNSLS